jgi:tetratricopeptide (TPR) repeat protein
MRGNKNFRLGTRKSGTCSWTIPGTCTDFLKSVKWPLISLLIFFFIIISMTLISFPNFPFAQAQTSDQVDPFYLDLLRDGKYFYKNGAYEDAIENFKIAFFGFLENPPKLAECYLYLTVCYYQIKNTEQAKFYYDEIKRLNLEDHIENLNLPQSLLDKYYEIDALEKGEPRRAVNFLDLARNEKNLNTKMMYYKQALRNDPSNLDIYFEMSHAYLDEEKYDEAVEVLQPLLKSQPKNVRIHIELAEIYLKDKSRNKAISVLKRAMAVAEDNIEINYLLGRAYMEDKKYEEAAAQFHIVLKKEPDYKDTRQLLEQCLQKIKE